MKINAVCFNEIEKKYFLYEDSIDGVNYWMYSRWDIWNYLMSLQNPNIGKPQNQPKGVGFRLKSYVKLLYNLLFGRRIRKKKVDLLFIIHERKVKVNGIYVCKYTDAIRRQYKDYYAFERLYEMGHLKPTDNHNLVYLDRISVNGNINYYTEMMFRRKRYKRLLNEIKRHMIAPVQELEEVFQISISLEYIARLIAQKILICKKKYQEYERVFSKIHPKLVIEVVHYSMDCMIINELAKKRGIRTAELQHGNIFDDHISYQYASEKVIKQLPDEIWLLSEYWKSEIHMPIEEQYLIPVGFPYFEKCIGKYMENCKNERDRKTILFISQGPIGRQLSEFAVSFAKMCSKEKYRIIYKLHPGEVSIWKEQYIELKQCDCIEVIENRDIDLYQLFAESDIQVGVYSTAIYEGIGFGLDTFICDLPYADDMKRLCQEGYAMLVKTPEELLEYVAKPRGSTHDMNEQTFWTKDALSNINKQIARILGKESGAYNEGLY